MSPDELYAIVCTYADFGNHLTGTDVDDRTTSWLAGYLDQIGAEVRLDPYRFEQWLASSELTLLDGTPVPHVPVFYSATGGVTSDDFAVIEVDHNQAGRTDTLNRHLDDSVTPIVFSLDGPDDLPVQCNRTPTVVSQTAALIAPGNWTDRLDRGAELRLQARSIAATSHNVVATLGPETGPPAFVTTPLSAWTPGAAERGTGLAAALAMAVELSGEHRVTFVACSGHELDFAGLRAWLADNTVADMPAIHLGASVGAIDADGDLDRSRMVLCSTPGDRRGHIGRLARGANWGLVDPELWAGEGGTWREAGAEVLSFVGHSRYFHTVNDLPETGTTPQAMATATATAIRTAKYFLGRT